MLAAISKRLEALETPVPAPEVVDVAEDEDDTSEDESDGGGDADFAELVEHSTHWAANGRVYARYQPQRAQLTLPMAQQLDPVPSPTGFDLYGDRTAMHIAGEKELANSITKHEYRALRCALPYIECGLRVLADLGAYIEDGPVTDCLDAATNTIGGAFDALVHRLDMVKLGVESKVNPSVITGDALRRLRSKFTPMAEGLELSSKDILTTLEDLATGTDRQLAKLTASKLAGAIANAGAQGAGGKKPTPKDPSNGAPAPRATPASRATKDKPSVGKPGTAKAKTATTPAKPKEKQAVHFAPAEDVGRAPGAPKGGRGGGRGGTAAGRGGGGRGSDAADAKKAKGKAPAAPSTESMDLSDSDEDVE